jgi:hypothetical protein
MTDYFTVEVSRFSSDDSDIYFDSIDIDIYFKDLQGNYISEIIIRHIHYNEHLEPLKKMRLELGKEENEIIFYECEGSAVMKATTKFITFMVYHFTKEKPHSLYSSFPINKEIEQMLDTIIEELEKIKKSAKEKSEKESKEEESEEEEFEEEESDDDHLENPQ